MVTHFSDATISDPTGITAGPDGNLWFTNAGNNSSIGRVTPAGVVTKFTDPTISHPEGIAAGPDGNLWFTNNYNNSIGRITPAGVVTKFTDRSINQPTGITAGPDGNLWFTNAGNNTIGRITPAGVVTNFTDPRISTAYVIAAGPDGNMWIAEEGRVVSVGTVPGVPGVPLGVTAVAAGDGRVLVSWSAPVSDGGSAVTGYVVTPIKAGVAALASVIFASAATSETVAGLTNGVAYTFSVAATNSAGTGRDSVESAEVTAAAYTADESFVIAAYHDFLGRAPSSAELSATVSALGGGASRDSVVSGLANSMEWVSQVVTRFYLDTLGRPADPGGLSYWVGLIRSGRLSVAQTAAAFYASDEYFSGIGGGTLSSWVTDLYTKVLQRSAAQDPAGLAYWVGVAQTHGRTTVAYAIYQSLESRLDRVNGLYQQLLGRPAEPAGLTYWAGQLSALGDVVLACNLADSAEYYTSAHTRYP